MIALILLVWLGIVAPGPAAPGMLIVIGAPGEEEFGELFGEWAQLWQAAAEKGGIKPIQIGGTTNDFDLVRTNLAQEAKEGPELWVVLIGHGTFDGKEPKFNLRGPDLSASDLAEWLKPFRRPEIGRASCRERV